MELIVLVIGGFIVNILILVSSIDNKLKDIIRVVEIIKNKMEEK